MVNHDGRGGLAPDLLVWSDGALPKRRRLVHAVRDRAFLPGPPGIPFGPGTDIWRSCRLIAAIVRSQCSLPGRLGRFLPCSIGANHCRLRHIGWERCGHGLTSRPRESASELFLNELLSLFRYPPGSARALLAGTLPLRFRSTRFACRTPTWRLPVLGQVARLVTASSGVVPEFIAEDVDHWGSLSWWFWSGTEKNAT